MWSFALDALRLASAQSRLACSRSLSSEGSGFRPVIVAGPSGVGKSTLITRLMNKYPSSFAFTVSHTTRQPRPNELAGQHYHFVSLSEFKEKVDRSEFVEHAEFAGNHYGTSLQALRDVEQRGRIPLLDIDMQGVKQVRRIPQIRPGCIFLSPPSTEELLVRLRGRGDTSEEAIQKRVSVALSEVEQSKEPGLFDATVISGEREKAWIDFEREVLSINKDFVYEASTNDK